MGQNASCDRPANRHPCGGFTLFELAVALSVLTIVSLTLLAMIVAMQKVTRETHEQDVALNAVRAYVEAMRARSTLPAIYGDASTPADYVNDPAILNPAGEVFKIDYEDGSSGIRASGVPGLGSTTRASFADGASLGFARDLNGNGTTTDLPASTSSLLVLPARVTLSWTSASDNSPRSLVLYVLFP